MSYKIKANYMQDGFRKGVIVIPKEEPTVVNWNFQGMLRRCRRQIERQAAPERQLSTLSVACLTPIIILKNHFVQNRQKVQLLCLQGRLVPHSSRDKESKLYNLFISYMQDLSMGRGNIFDPVRLKGLRVLRENFRECWIKSKDTVQILATKKVYLQYLRNR